jgi:hypothetical protein
VVELEGVHWSKFECRVPVHIIVIVTDVPSFFPPKFNAQIRSGRIRDVQQERWKNFQINRADIKDGQTSCNVKEQGREMRSTHRSSRLDALHSLEAQRTVNQGGNSNVKRKKKRDGTVNIQVKRTAAKLLQLVAEYSNWPNKINVEGATLLILVCCSLSLANTAQFCL